jgi:hypothetical protein
MGKVVVLKDVRLAFPQDLWTPGQYEGKGAFSYGAQFLMAPDSEAKKICDEAIREVAVAEWKSKADMCLEEYRMNKQKFPFLNGDRRPEYNGFPGNWALTAKAQEKKKPLVVNKNPKIPVGENDGIIYGGCYVNAKVEFWAQSGTNAGVRCSLLVVQFVRDGDSFGGGAMASIDDMDDLGFEDEDDLL